MSKPTEGGSYRRTKPDAPLNVVEQTKEARHPNERKRAPVAVAPDETKLVVAKAAALPKTKE